MKTQTQFEILYEDERLIAVNKKAGIAVCADRWDAEKPRLDKVLGEIAGFRVWIVHRLDADTSGVVVFAKNEKTHTLLSQIFENRLAKKTYIACVQGRPFWKEQSCDFALVPDGNKRHETIVDKFKGKKSLTRFTVICTAGNYAALIAEPEKGRTHQIRVHAAALRHPVCCDPIYGSSKGIYLSSFKKKWRGDPADEKPLISRLALHAEKLTLPDYGFGEQCFYAPPPRDLQALLNQMEKCGQKYAAIL